MGWNMTCIWSWNSLKNCIRFCRWNYGLIIQYLIYFQLDLVFFWSSCKNKHWRTISIEHSVQSALWPGARWPRLMPWQHREWFYDNTGCGASRSHGHVLLCLDKEIWGSNLRKSVRVCNKTTGLHMLELTEHN